MVFKVFDRLKEIILACTLHMYVDRMIQEVITKRSDSSLVSLAWIARKPLTDLWFWDIKPDCLDL